MVPMLTCGLLRTNFSLAMTSPSQFDLFNPFLRSGRRGSNPRRLAWKARALPAELHPQALHLLSPRAGLNRRPRPYQGRALPTELRGQIFLHVDKFVEGEGFEPS